MTCPGHESKNVSFVLRTFHTHPDVVFELFDLATCLQQFDKKLLKHGLIFYIINTNNYELLISVSRLNWLVALSTI